MFIRRTKTRTTEDGKEYVSHHLVQLRRDGEQVRQQTSLNPGGDFAVDRQHWPLLCGRISQLPTWQATLRAAAMAALGLERATWRWPCERSALGDLLGTDFETVSLMRLYPRMS